MANSKDQLAGLAALKIALEGCERRHDELINAVTDYIYAVKVDKGKVIETVHSASCVGVTGFSCEEYAADPYLWLNMIHEEDRAGVLRQMANILFEDEPNAFEHRIYHKDGSVRWIHNTLVRRYDTEGRLVAYDGLIRDVTERKIAEKTVEDAANEWRKTFDSISDFVSVHGKDFKILRANKALADFFDAEPDELVGKYCYEVIHGMKGPWPECPHLEALKIVDTVTKEVNDPNIGRNLLVTCSPYFDDRGEVIGTVHVARDITKDKLVEAEKEKLIIKLQTALKEVKTLRGILPICSFCKKIKDEQGVWKAIDSYIYQHSEADISHAVCPECMEENYPEEYKMIVDEKNKGK